MCIRDRLSRGSGSSATTFVLAGASEEAAWARARCFSRPAAASRRGGARRRRAARVCHPARAGSPPAAAGRGRRSLRPPRARGHARPRARGPAPPTPAVAPGARRRPCSAS
eukprot:13749465-Alexandrium_andersonii.AAC.1